MVQVFRLRRSSLRQKIPLLSLVGLIALVLNIGMSAGITYAAPLFSNPVTAAAGLYYTDTDMQTRPTDGFVFAAGTAFTVSGGAHLRNWLGLTVLNNGNPNDSVNVDGAQEDVPQKYPSIAFSPVDGTGYVVWRTKHNGGNFTSDLRVIPPAYNGSSNKTLGTQFEISSVIGYTIDQPAVAVDANGNINIVAYAKTSPVTLRLITLNKNNFAKIGDVAIDTQPGGAVAEMDPQICMDGNNVHVTSQFPYGTDSTSPVKEFAYDRIVGNGFVKTMITPAGWRELRGNKSKDMFCGSDGTTYVAINNTGQYDLYKRLPGAGSTWNLIKSNVFSSGSNQGVYGDSMGVTVSSDGRVWAAQADTANSNHSSGVFGAIVKYSTDGGFNFSAPEQAIPNSSDYDNANYLAISASSDNKVHLIMSTQSDYSVYTSKYAYALTASPPAQVTGVTATQAGTNQINVTWNANNPAPDSYKVYRSTDNVNFTLIAQGIGGTSYNDTSVNSATTYYYKVSAVKGSLEGLLSVSASATTLLAAPATVNAVAASSSEIDVSWSSSNGATGYNVYRSTNPTTGFATIATGVVGNSYANTGLPLNATYYYRVTALKTGLPESAQSPTATATTLSPASLIFLNNINSGAAGTALNNFSVQVVDNKGNVVSNYTGNVVLSVTPNTGNGNLSGTTTKAAVAGVADFSGANLKLDAIGIGYQLRATADNGAYGDSSTFNQSGTLSVSPVAGGLHATDPFNITVTVQANGVTDTKFNGRVTLNLQSAPGGAYTYGMTSVVAVNGIASFKYLMGDTVGAYSYQATLGNPALAPDPTATAVSLVAYTNATPCTRILVTTATTAGGADTCTATSVQTALNTANATTIPVYVDHRAGPTGLGAGQHPDSSSTLTIPAGSILDGGCTTANGQGLTMTIFNGPGGLTVSGNNNYLRGIFFSGDNSTTALLNLTSSKGNTLSCDKVQFVSGP